MESEKMAEPGKLTLNGIFWGFILPVIIGVLIVAIPAVIGPALNGVFPAADPLTGEGGSPYAFITIILTHGLASMVVMGVPMFIGLNWSKWAGGAAGFLLGSIYYIAWSGYNIMYSMNTFTSFITGETVPELRASIQSYLSSFVPNLYRDPSFIGNYIVGAMLIGYITGALNAKSFSFKRKLGASLTAAITIGIFQFVLNYTVAFSAWMTQQGDVGFALFTVMLPMIILGIIIPVISRITAGGELWHP
jgi:hypothetical protein